METRTALREENASVKHESEHCPERQKKPYLAIGSAGGSRIITGTLQGIINAIDFDMNPEQLVNAPYVNCLTREQGLEAEFGISQDTLRLLEERGINPYV